MEEVMRDFNVCHATDSHLYFCEGPKYNQFAKTLETLLLTHQQSHRETSQQITHAGTTSSSSSSSSSFAAFKSRCWGKRPFPFPANATILAVGNSHTRQLLLSLACQYPTLYLLEPEFNETNATVKRRATYYSIQFLNHAKLHLVPNHALFYSRKWQEYLESTVNTKLEDFDLLIVGKINTFNEAYNTSFMTLMLENTKDFEDADFKTIPPPTLYHFARLFSGPIVAHSMMADDGHGIWNREMRGMVKRLNRSNIHFVNGRTYIPWLGECSSDDYWDQVGDCSSNPKGHRCVGRRGGHPDLVAWEIIEATHNYSNSCTLP